MNSLHFSERNHPSLREFAPDPDKLNTPAREYLGGKLKDKSKNRYRNKSVHYCLKPVLLVAQCIFVFPLHGILSNDHNDVKFVLRSFKSFCSLFMICMGLTLSAFTIYRLFIEGVNYRIIGDIFFFGTATISMIFFFQLAVTWKDLIAEWAQVDNQMEFLQPINMSRKIYIFVVYVMSMSICEHLLANSDTFFAKGESRGQAIRVFYINAFRQVFAFTEFSTWKGALLSIFNFFITMTWNFTDLFLMTVSMVLSSRFSQINKELERVTDKSMPLEYWRKIRETYNRVALLTKAVDKKLSFLVVVSFTSNLYFICLQLLHSLKPLKSTIKAVYFFISFGHLLFRTCGVCLFAASIFDNSKQPLAVLFSVSSDTYNIEVQRFTTQVAFDTIALTGCKFFAITRTLMLTVAGTIVTYEIVLVQFNSLVNDGGA